MRANHDFAPPPVQPPPQDGPPQPPCPESSPRQSKARKGWAPAPEKDRLDYDDGAWM
jgi:hypothetical protein